MAKGQADVSSPFQESTEPQGKNVSFMVLPDSSVY